MNDQEKTKEQLLQELLALRQRVADLEGVAQNRQQTEDILQAIKAELELKVEERTIALKASNDQLVAEVAERHQAEVALRAAKDQLEAVLEAVPGIVSWINSDLRYLGVNRHLAKSFGMPPEAFVGQDIGFLNSSSDFNDFVQQFFDSPAQDDFREITALVNGKPRNFLIVVQKYDSDRAAFAVGIDITERHQAETALREAEGKYRGIFENAVEGIFQTTPDGYYLSANSTLARIYGYESAAELMANLTSVEQQLYVDPARRSEFTCLLNQHGSVLAFESQVYRKDGSLIWISENARAVHDDVGNLLYYEGTVEDITERKHAQEALQRANEELEIRVEERTAALKELNRRLVIEIGERQRVEAALRASEAELRALFAAMTDVITVFDGQGRYLKMVGTNSQLPYKPEVDRIGKTVYEVLPPAQATLFISKIQRALNTGKTVSLEYSLPISNPDDTGAPRGEAWFVANVSPMPDNCVIWVARDITNRKKAEEALRQAETKYRSIFENAAEGIFQTTRAGRHLSANPALVRMYGYRSEEELITLMPDIGSQLYVQPNRRDDFVAALEQHDVVSNFESEIYRKDGSIIWTSENARAVRDEQGNLLYYEGTVEDITKRKQAEEALRQSETQERERSQQLAQTLQELQQTQAQLVQSEKMSSLGQLVAGVAHEINNPVNFIYGNLVYATRYMKDLLDLAELNSQVAVTADPELRAKIEAIDLDFLKADLPKLMASMRVGAERIREIVRSLQNFSRLDEAERKVVDIHEGLDSTLMILQHRLKSDAQPRAIEVVREYADLPKLRCSAGQLNQVFMNILSNAIDALEERMREEDARIKDENDDAEAAGEAGAAGEFVKPVITIRTEQIGDRVAIHIADNGLGMQPDVQQRVFDPFFTTKPVGKGTGLGMSISHQIIVERHGGQIHCFSIPGTGTEFLVELPLPSLGKPNPEGEDATLDYIAEDYTAEPSVS
jgi:PAS domain S-box-containing protein